MLSRYVTLICNVGVIQKDPHFVPVVNNARGVLAHGAHLRHDRYDEDDDFDL